MKALAGLLRKEAYHILRDRRTLAVILMLPVIQVVLFGYAVRTDVQDVRIAIVDPAPDPVTTMLRSRLAGGGVFKVVATLPNAEPLEKLFRSGEAQAAVVLEPDFAQRLGRGERAQVLLISDATEPNTGATIQGYLISAMQTFLPPDQQRGVVIVPRPRLRFNPTAESKNLFVPGLMAFVLTIISSLMTAITLTREKETGTMEALLVSPLRPWQIIVGKVTPYLAIGFISVVGVVLEARVVFRVPFRGSGPLLMAEAMLFILVSLALGVLISARSANQRVAMTMALLGTMLPTLILSGFLFPLESMPTPLQWLANIVPAKWFVVIVRGIMLKGIGIEHLWRETLVLGGMAVVLLTLSVRSFHARLE
ncbi:MAG TPA: ABC transporter permease [Thermoanaerobaculia bacterium]|nr:ABC transporter permease [Thermoanaerobaculia bacterium]